jgi:hypothetical protein
MDSTTFQGCPTSCKIPASWHVAYTLTLTGVDGLHLLSQHRTQPREPASCLQTKRRTSLSHFSRPSPLRGIVDHYLITPALEHLVMASNSGPWFHGGMCTALGRSGQSHGPNRRSRMPFRGGEGRNSVRIKQGSGTASRSRGSFALSQVAPTIGFGACYIGLYRI